MRLFRSQHGPCALVEASAYYFLKALGNDLHFLNLSDAIWSVVYTEYFSCNIKNSVRFFDTSVLHFEPVVLFSLAMQCWKQLLQLWEALNQTLQGIYCILKSWHGGWTAGIQAHIFVHWFGHTIMNFQPMTCFQIRHKTPRGSIQEVLHKGVK